MSAPVLRSTGGSRSLRSCLTRSVVACACGAERGYALNTTVRPDGLTRGGVTDATPGVELNVFRICPRAAVSPLRGSSAATTSGPLKPLPKPCASRSYALRVVLPAGSLPASLEPGRIDRAGTASTSMIARPATAAVHGWRLTHVAQL